MAFSGFFSNKAKSNTDSTVIVGAAVPKQYKPRMRDLWVHISGDGQNVMLKAFDDKGNPKKGGVWQRSPKLVVQATDPAGANEAQIVTILGGPTGGTWTLGFLGQIATGIVYNATAAALQTALQALSTIGAGNVAVTGSTGGPYTITFQGTLGHRNVPALVANASGLTGGTTPSVTVAEQTAGSDTTATTGIQANDVWGNNASSSTVFKSYTGTDWK